ncbi:GmrSD restriction endonuclease domain-containing protein [Psychrobacter glacincola]|uniref:GmrSD restriction endonuclease domain-containing protein n=1 Tax=Psychrobacter glacincola TaxID=56810 RepID=UPI003FCFF780
MKMPSSSAKDRQVSVWFQKIQSGEIKLPRFQRHQAWDKNRVCSLLDTVTKNLPLGVTLLLDVDKEQFVSRYLVTAPETQGRVTEHLLDGQQRLTSLWRALHNNYEDINYFLYLNAYDESVPENEKTDESEVWYKGRWINRNGNRMPLWVDEPSECLKRGLIPMNLFRPGDISDEIEEWIDSALSSSEPNADEEDYKALLKQWMGKQEKIKNKIRDFREVITHFNLPYLALPSQTSKETALQVFINMNTNSKPLSQYDIIRAEIEGVKDVSLDDYQNELDKKYPTIKHYFELPFLILATSALIQGKLPNQRGMWDMNKEDMVDNWDRMSLGLSKMATFMESQAIYDRARLPTNAVLAVIAALYVDIPENLDSRGNFEILLKKYLWSSFFTDRYENAAASHAFNDFIMLRNIITAVTKADGSLYTENDVQVLNRDLYPLATDDELKRIGWPKRENIRGRGIMAVFSKLGAYDFADGSPLTRQQLIDGRRHYHHVFPDALLKEIDAESYFALNCALITDKTNLNISNKDPLSYLKDRYNWTSEDIVNARLQSHLIPLDELKCGDYTGLSGDEKVAKVKSDFSQFITKRAAYVAKAIRILAEGRDINASEIIRDVEEQASLIEEASV